MLKDFKSNNFVSAHSTGFTGAFYVSADSKRVTKTDERQSIAPPKRHEPLSETRIVPRLFPPRCVFFAFFSGSRGHTRRKWLHALTVSALSLSGLYPPNPSDGGGHRVDRRNSQPHRLALYTHLGIERKPMWLTVS